MVLALGVEVCVHKAAAQGLKKINDLEVKPAVC